MMDMLDSDWDCESYTETSDSEDQDDTESTYGGHAQSILSSLDESIGKIDDFLAFERGFVHGDIVYSATDPSGQMGRVVDVDMVVDLESVYGGIIKGVNSKKLLKIRSFAAGDYVVHGPWLGRVDRVFDLVTILFDDGAKCEVLTGDTENVVPVSPSPLEDAPCPYYPGQRVQIKRSTIFNSARWLCGTWKGSRDVGTVSNAEVGSVRVDWIGCAVVGHGIVPSTPPCLQDPKKLTLLSCFPYANWQLGDWCKLPHDYSQNLQMSDKELVSHNIPPQHLTKMHKLRMKDHGCEQMYVIVKTKTKVDVLWQDGKLSVGLDLQTLFPVNSVGDHDFWPEQFVLEKATSEDAQVSTGKRLGVVNNVDALERTVKVRWMVLELNQLSDSNGEFSEETLSAYELIEHPDYSYSLGDVVFRLPHSEYLEETPFAIHTDLQRKRHNNIPTEGVDLSSLQVLERDTLEKISFESHEYASGYLSCIGNVIGFKNGGIEVRWANGLKSKVEPSEIFGIDRFDDPASTPVFNEDTTDENVSKEVAEQENQSWQKKEKDVLEKAVTDSGEDCEKNMRDASVQFFPRVALGFLTNVATSLFGYRGSTSLSGTIDSVCFDSLNKSCVQNLETPASKTANGFDHWRSMSVLQSLKAEDVSLDVEDSPSQTSLKKQEVKVNEPPAVLAGGERTAQFKKFDIVDDYSDHHFVNGVGKGLMSSQVQRDWLKKVQHEWSILKKDLPDTIYVRVYEERMDLLKACIVGAPGTPYHDALFFFDICFPPDYPHEPPLVHYNSGGLRLNPNLYESGKVCLSLLNTWTGTGTEVWNPESSSILQVLISLQALVLNEKPYFNEAGYDKQIGRAEGERNSMTYNENAFLLSFKSMLYLLRKPPKHFEALVEEHFTCRSHHILFACKAYMDGAQVGCAFRCEKVASEIHRSSSTGFKIMLAKLFPKLLLGFAERGIDCSQFVDHANQVSEKGQEHV